MKAKLKEAFRRGLMKAARSTGKCILYWLIYWCLTHEGSYIYNYLFEPHSWWGVLDTTLCDNVCPIINVFISFISVLTSTLTNWKQTKNGYILATCLINFVFIHFGKSMWSFWMESNLCRIYLLIVYICISTRVQLTTRRGGGLGSH
jgi:hypothetical protein